MSKKNVKNKLIHRKRRVGTYILYKNRYYFQLLCMFVPKF